MPDCLVIEVFDREVRQQSSVGELVARDVDYCEFVLVMDVVVSPLPFPALCLEADGEGAGHLDGLADGQVGRGLVVEEAEDLVVQVDRGAGQLDGVDDVVLPHRQLRHILHECFKLFLLQTEKVVCI